MPSNVICVSFSFNIICFVYVIVLLFFLQFLFLRFVHFSFFFVSLFRVFYQGFLYSFFVFVFFVSYLIPFIHLSTYQQGGNAK